MFVKKRASSMKQIAYARRLLGAQGDSKKSIAMDVGYSPNVANSIATHIENKPGFHNAMAALAVDSNNLALAAMHEFKARGFGDFSNKDLIGALNAIGSAWSRFNQHAKDKGLDNTQNKLRTIVLQQIENQNINSGTTTTPATPQTTPQIIEVENQLDF